MQDEIISITDQEKARFQYCADNENISLTVLLHDVLVATLTKKYQSILQENVLNLFENLTPDEIKDKLIKIKLM